MGRGGEGEMKSSSRKQVVAAIAAVALVALAGTASAKWSILNQTGFGDIAVCTDGAIVEQAFFEASTPYPPTPPPGTDPVLEGSMQVTAFKVVGGGSTEDIGSSPVIDVPYAPVARGDLGTTFYYSHRGATVVPWTDQAPGETVFFRLNVLSFPDRMVGDCSIFGVELLDHLRPNKHDKARLVLYGAANFDAASATGLTLGALETVAAAPADKEKVKDFDGDGYLDVKLRFDTQDAGVTCATRQLLLQGSTPGGTFAKVEEAALRGC
jgi:hypothetical protein